MTVVRSVMMYGSEYQATSKKEKLEMKVTEMKNVKMNVWCDKVK